MAEHKPSTRDPLILSIGSYRDSAVRHVSDALRGGTDHDVHGNRPASLKHETVGINLDYIQNISKNELSRITNRTFYTPKSYRMCN